MVLLVSSAVAAPIAGADVICTGLGQVPIDLGPNGGCLPGIFSVEVASPPGAPPDFQESDNFQENFVFIVIAGPEHGFVTSCSDGEALGGSPRLFGSAGFSASFLGAGVSGGTRGGLTRLVNCGSAGGTNFTLGVPIESQLSLSAFVTGNLSRAMAEVTGLKFFVRIATLTDASFS